MKTMQWTFLDRTGWDSGPWDNEPDKAQWADPVTGMPCMIHRGPMGNWCGYVGVAPEHPAYQQDYGSIGVSVHGGLTFSNHCDPKHDAETGHGICHLPEPGEPDAVWWLGFDCGHAFDISPKMQAFYRESGLPPMPGGIEVYRDMAYVREECTQLAAQLQALGE